MSVKGRLWTGAWMRLTVSAGILSTLAACGQSGAGAESDFATTNDDFAPTFWHQRDDFTKIDAYYLDVKLWIDREGGQFLDLQFQCFRHEGAKVSIDQNLLVNSEFVQDADNSWATYVDAVLFKSGDEYPRVYPDQFSSGGTLGPFTSATLDLGFMLKSDGNEDFRSLDLRFVHGARHYTTADVGELSRAPSVDFTLSATQPETSKFLRACAPVKNWVPPE